ncbi:MAG: ArnT family glycosyltransferase [Ilumatobacteraceae bacterium]
MSRVMSLVRRHWALSIPSVVSTVLSSWAIGTVGWGNTYYAAAVRSMSRSWTAFFYGSLDRASFVTVDKPPLSMWVQALVVRVFGFHSMSLLVPQVLAGVGAVVLVYATAARRWGRAAATAGALALAITPISVMVNHSNNTDAILTLCMTASACAAVHAATTHRLRWGVVAGLLFGAAFTTKMLAAAPILPAVVGALVVAAGITWRRRALLVVTTTAVAIVAALAWFTIVDLIPTDQRPYIGSSNTNSAYQLAFERNGVNQVEGDASVMGGTGPGAGGQGGDDQPPPDGASAPPAGTGSRPNGGGPGGGGPGGNQGFSGGEAGLLRLFNSDLGTQLGWLVAPGLLGLGGAAFASGRRRWWREPTVVVPALWFAGGAAAYSITEGIVHPYYLASIAPPLAMGLAAGVGAARRTWHRLSTRLAVGTSLAITGLVDAVLAHRTDHTATLMGGAATLGIGLGAIGWVLVMREHDHDHEGTDRDALDIADLDVIETTSSVTSGARSTAQVGSAALLLAGTALLAPAVWTIASLRAGLSANLPYASPTSTGFGGMPDGRANGPGATTDARTIEYLEAQRHGETWLVATTSAMQASPIIIETGEAVIALGGFSGNDLILDEDGFDALVAGGDLRFVLLEQGGMGGRGPGRGQSTLTTHITDVCTPVDAVSSSLYDCAT